MPRSRDNVRDFPGRRWLNLSLRAAHLAGVVLLGAALLGGGGVATGAWLTLLSGLATPVENMPEILQTATYANPLRFAIDMVRRIYLEGASLADISHNFLPLACIAALSMPLAAWLFRNRLN